MIGGVAAELRLRIDKMEAMVQQYVIDEVVPHIKETIAAAARNFDIEAAVNRIVQQEYENAARRAVEQHVQLKLWNERKKIEAYVAKRLREASK
jgi:hypothetical protein